MSWKAENFKKKEKSNNKKKKLTKVTKLKYKTLMYSEN
jgi:hypothetical protein